MFTESLCVIYRVLSCWVGSACVHRYVGIQDHMFFYRIEVGFRYGWGSVRVWLGRVLG